MNTFDKKSAVQKDTESTHSAFSVFSTIEGARQRFQVIKEGYLDVSKQGKGGAAANFSSKYCRLTKDGRITFEDNHSKETLVVKECCVSDAAIFRLMAMSEADLVSKDLTEILCRAKNEEEGTEWLISVETALRSRLQAFRNELDCARGTMDIVEIGNKLNTTPDMDKAKRCQCFYYNGNLRVKNLDGPQTSSFVVAQVSTDDINLPMCLIIETRGRNFVCRADDVDNFKKWLYTIRKDLKKKDGTPREGENVDSMKSDMLVGPAPDKMIRVSARYLKTDHIFETKDFAGVIDAFYVQRCIIMPPKSKEKFNIILAVCMLQDEAETKPLQLYANSDLTLMPQWKQAFQVDMYKVAAIIDKAIMQIELRRIMKDESSANKNKRFVSFHDIHFIMTLTDTQMEDQFSRPDEWNVGRLERLIQMALKVPVEPLIAYSFQKDFIDLGKEIAASKTYKDTHVKRAFDLIEKLDDVSRTIMEKLALHIFRLVSHYNKKKGEKGSSGRHSSGGSRKSSMLYSQANHDLTVWTRLNKYIFRFNEQNLNENVVDSYLSTVSHTIVAFQARYVELLRKQATTTSTKHKKEDFESSCTQQ